MSNAVDQGQHRYGGQEEGARALGVLYLAGAALGFLTLLLPAWDGRDEGGIVTAATISLVVGALVWAGRRTLRRRVQQVIVVLGNVLVTMAVAASGPASSSFALLYVWISLYCFYFDRWPTATAHVALSAVLYGTYLLGEDATPSLQLARLLVTFGTTLAAGVVVGRLVRQVRGLALQDGLTGLANRRAWEAGLHDLLTVERRQASIVLVDLDRFKELNDESGHLAGDEALRAAALVWRSRLGDRSLLARLGGDEFGLALPDCGLERALEVAEGLRAALPDGLTCSVGVACRAGDDEAAAGLLARADAALYAAKAAGRDRVVAS